MITVACQEILKARNKVVDVIIPSSAMGPAFGFNSGYEGFELARAQAEGREEGSKCANQCFVVPG